MHLGKKNKQVLKIFIRLTIKIVFSTRFFVTFHKLLHLGIKNKHVYFVLHSIFRNFAPKARTYFVSAKKGMNSFVLLSTFRNFK